MTRTISIIGIFLLAVTWQADAKQRRAAKHKAHASESCLPPSLRDAMARVRRSCPNVRVISTHRPGARIAGTRTRSMHASCRAVDFTTSDYACAYRVLANWPGKMSMDARRARHIHLDTGSYARFVHGRQPPRRSRVAEAGQ